MKSTYKDELEKQIEWVLFLGEKATGCNTREDAIAYIKHNRGNMVALAEANAIFFRKDKDDNLSDCDLESMFKLSVSYSEYAPERTNLVKELHVLGYYKDECDALASMSDKLRHNELLCVKRKPENDIVSRLYDSVAILNYDEVAKTGKFGDPNTIFGEFKIEKVAMY